MGGLKRGAPRSWGSGSGRALELGHLFHPGGRRLREDPAALTPAQDLPPARVCLEVVEYFWKPFPHLFLLRSSQRTGDSAEDHREESGLMCSIVRPVGPDNPLTRRAPAHAHGAPWMHLGNPRVSHSVGASLTGTGPPHSPCCSQGPPWARPAPHISVSGPTARLPAAPSTGPDH